MQISEADFRRAQEMERAAYEEAIERARLLGESTEARRAGMALEALRQLATPIQGRAVAELLRFDPNKDERDRANLMHKILGEDLLTAATRIREEGITPMIAARFGHDEEVMEPLAFVRGEAISLAFKGALTTGRQGIPLVPNSDRSEVSRMLYPTRVPNAYVITYSYEKGSWADSASLVAATPKAIERQKLSPSPSR